MLATDLTFANCAPIPGAATAGHCLKPKPGLDRVWANADTHVRSRS